MAAIRDPQSVFNRIIVKKTLLIFGAVLLSVLCLSACGSDDDDPNPPQSGELKLSEESYAAPAEGGVLNVRVTAPGEWDASSSADWVKLTKSGTLDREGSITLTVEKSLQRSPRTAIVTVLSGSARANVTITQEGVAPDPTDPSMDVPEGYDLVWHDEFDGDELNRADWTHEVQSSGWVNNELQNYVNTSYDGKFVTEVGDGTLKINCFKASNGKIYSGRIYAKVNQGWKFGIVEARIKLPKGRGTWPAFWMMPVNNDFGANPWPKCGEIDIMEEVGYHPNYTSSSIHCESYNHVIGTQKTAERYTAGAEDDFHVYRLEWTAEYIRTYVDGQMLLNFVNDGKNNVSTWPFSKPFYVILNLAWGGSWGGIQGTDDTRLPATMEVDYVRVFQK